MANEKWTREQTIVALNLYCKIPFKNVNSTHPDILSISKLIGRSPNSLKMKIGNFGSFDPELKSRGIVGLSNTSKLDSLVWEEFQNDWENLVYESTVLLSQFMNQTIESSSGISIDELPLGIDREVFVKQRVNQQFFRSSILASYGSKCCITGLNIIDLLVASHIIPWAKDTKNRLNPRNGLCLNSIHDKAFDKGLITITPDLKIKISKTIREFQKSEVISNYFLQYENKTIATPEKFLPSAEFLNFHNQEIFQQ
jgi:putative restriction endonuclease